MPKYRVTLEEKVRYYVDVEAEDDEDASTKAEEIWVQSGDPNNDFAGDGQGVTVKYLAIEGIDF